MTAAGELAEALLNWYGAVRRDLPWRRTTDPYAILVSEVMLQQTQVARVVPRYEAWLERWPTAADLAGASRAEVLAAWVGLGYNRRALALHAAAAAIARDGWPENLRALPGVGAYTAAAVGSFAFGEQVAAVDTNVRRVAARLGHGAPGELLPRGACGRLQPGDDGARGDRLHGPRRRAARRARWRPGAPRRAACRRPPGRARPAPPSASRTPTAGCAGASSRRSRRATGCRATSRPNAWLGPSRASSATAWCGGRGRGSR